MNFILSVRNHESLDFSYELSKDKMEQIIYRLNDYEFEQIEILNFDLLDYLIELDSFSINQNTFCYNKKIRNIINTIINELEPDDKYNFIDGFYEEKTKSKGLFFKLLCHEWCEIWSGVVTESDFTKEEIYEYLVRIIKYSYIDDIKKINESSKRLTEEAFGDSDDEFCLDIYISYKVQNFLELTKDIKLEKLKEIIDKLNIKFSDIYTYLSEGYTSYTEILNYIFDNNYYQINIKMLKKIFEFKPNGDTIKFDKSNFTSILKLGYEPLISYIQDNFKEYITNVFFKLENNTEESLQSIVNILNNSSLAEELEIKLQVIRKENFKISDLELVGQDLWDEILKEDKIMPLWKCIYQYFSLKGEINDILKDYIQRNFKELVVSEDINIELSDDKIKHKFMEAVWYVDFTNECYESMVKAFNYKIDLDIDRLSESQIKILIRLHYFNLDYQTFSTIKQRFPNMQINYIMSYKDEFMNRLDEFNLKNDDVELLLPQTEFSPTDKINIVDKALDDDMTENIAKQILNLLDDLNEITEELFKKMWKVLADKDDRIKLLIKQLHNMQSNNVTGYLNELGDEFSDIPQSDKTVEMQYSNAVFALAKELTNVEYISSCSINEKEDPETKEVQKYVQFSPKVKAKVEIED